MKDYLRVERAQSTEELDAAFSIRNTVFFCEQKIPAELDKDGMDEDAVHVLAHLHEKPVATGRLVVVHKGLGIAARIAVLRGYRGRGIGRLVVKRLEVLAKKMGVRHLELHPHVYLEKFYAQLGFQKSGGGETVGGHKLITMTKDLGK
jgi:predicted GNAT family N-acyltransferase